MGMYDYIETKCFNCGNISRSQTKLGVCILKTYQLGDLFDICDSDLDIHNCILALKDCCTCGEILKIKICNRYIIKCEEEDRATYQENCWGEVEKLEEELK